MLSFSNKVKKQIIQSGSQDEHCQAAEAYGLLLFSRLLDVHRSVFRTSMGAVARRAAELIAACCGVYVKVTAPASEADQRGSYTVEIPHIEQRMAITGRFGSDPDHINAGLIDSEESRIAFLRGAFLASGTMSDPEKSFHLEIAAHSPELCTELCALMRGMGIKCSTLMRKSGCSAYIKGSADIELLLGELGAAGAYMEVIEVRINREVSNRANRTTNCDEANITKTVTAAGAQLAAIRKIEQAGGLGSLPEELRLIARHRLDNPEMSLRELGETMEPKLSRSGVNHRLQKLMDIAKAMDEPKL